MNYAVVDVGRIGLLTDFLNHNVPLNAWTDGLNVRFRDDGVFMRRGWQDLDGEPGEDEDRPASVETLFTIGAGPDGTRLILCGRGSVWVRNATQYYNITREESAYEDVASHWSGTIFGGLLVVHNGVDLPQYWADTNVTTKLQNAPSWPSGVRTNVLRSYRSYLFMGDVVDDGVRYPERVRWSAAAAPGLMPDDYDVLSQTNDANEVECRTSGYPIVEMLPLGGAMIAYKQDSIWSLDYTGSLLSAFSVRPVLQSVGALDIDCVKPVKNGRGHIIFTGDDLVLFDGNSADTVLDKRTRRKLQQDVIHSEPNSAFLADYAHQRETWLFYNTGIGTGGCNACLVWNWDSGAVAFFQADEVVHAVAALQLPQGNFSWDSLQNTSWDRLNRSWDPFQYQRGQLPLVRTKVGAKQSTYELGTTNNGAPFRAYVERRGIAFPVLTENKWLWKQRMQLNTIWPHALGGRFYVAYGTQEIIDGPVTWYDKQLFIPGQTEFIDTGGITGRYLAVRFESFEDTLWNLRGYELDIEPAGDA